MASRLQSDTPAIISCALIGGESSSPNPHQPRTLTEIVREGIDAGRAGASVLHIHARDEEGRVTQGPNVYREIEVRLRRELPDVILNYTTGGSEGMSDDERLASLEARPQIASLDCGSMNFGEDVFVSSPAFLERAARMMKENDVKPESECFDAGMIGTWTRLVERGLIARPPLVQLVLGVLGGAPARVETLTHFVSLLPHDCIWASTSIGRAHFPMMAVTLALGGHIRTGLEDVAYSARGEFATSNAELVERAARLSVGIGRPVATAAEAREILSIARIDTTRTRSWL